MMNFKRRLGIISLALITGMTLSGCNTKTTDKDDSTVTPSFTYLTDSEKVENASKTLQSLSEAREKVPVSSTKITGKITIEKAGNYYVNSTIEGKKITVACEGVTLYLVNANLSNEKKVIESDYDLTITLIGSNTITNSNSKGSNAIDCAGNLIINGSGSLSVTSTKNAIKANTITISKTTLVLNAKKDGLHAEVGNYDSADDEPTPDYSDGGSVFIYDSDITITDKDDGIQADTYVFIAGDSKLNITSSSKGITAGCIDWGVSETELDWDGYLIYINSGDITINSTDDSLHSNGDLVIDGGNLNLTTGDDGAHADYALSVNGGNITIANSYEGLEGATVDITGGVIDISATDDGINAAGGKDNSGFGMDDSFGNMFGEMNADGSFNGSNMGDFTGQMPEGSDMQMPDGTTGNTDMQMSEGSDMQMPNIGGQMGDMGNFGDMGGGQPSDDMTEGGMFGGDSSYYINISGGKITIVADGDGVDSNGSLYISGGELYVSGPLSADDSAVDFDGTAQITGGIVVGAGSSGMAENFDSTSTQGSILMNFTENTEGEITLVDSDGNVLVSYTPAKAYTSVLISCPALAEGNTYTLTCGSTSNSITMTSLQYSNGTFGAMDGNQNMGQMPNMGGQMPDMNGQFGQTPNFGTTDIATSDDEK
jgi:hypothetical protein